MGKRPEHDIKLLTPLQPFTHTMKTAHIKVQLDPGATMPTRAHATDVGYDVTCAKFYIKHTDGAEEYCTTIEQVRRAIMNYRRFICEDDTYLVIIDTGVHVQPEPGYYVELVPNSRQSKTSIRWGNSIGVIDPTYTGSIKIILHNIAFANPGDLANYLPGKVVGQLIVRPYLSADFEQVDSLAPTERGEGGFGSTANK